MLVIHRIFHAHCGGSGFRLHGMCALSEKMYINGPLSVAGKTWQRLFEVNLANSSESMSFADVFPITTTGPNA
jgi:hypothetical protein